MEALVVARHGNQFGGRRKSRGTNHFGSPPLGGFKGMNCRSSESAAGLCPSPPSVLQSFDSFNELQAPDFYSEPPKPSKRSNPIAIRPKPIPKELIFDEDVEGFSYSELWAGPAYSKSPPPSSLPIPKFSLRPKRSLSLELPPPLSSSGIELPPVAKSAPPSPTRDFFTSATDNLRKILHLDIADN